MSPATPIERIDCLAAMAHTMTAAELDDELISLVTVLDRCDDDLTAALAELFRAIERVLTDRRSRARLMVED